MCFYSFSSSIFMSQVYKKIPKLPGQALGVGFLPPDPRQGWQLVKLSRRSQSLF